MFNTLGVADAGRVTQSTLSLTSEYKSEAIQSASKSTP
jgi:hypothetical protein